MLPCRDQDPCGINEIAQEVGSPNGFLEIAFSDSDSERSDTPTLQVLYTQSTHVEYLPNE